ncbi:MAG TPA: hypothetical protein VKA04_11720 [Pseudodesulfovibrio sp.]|nr:hypothetical protein [Pseudodesulfovibrio sp.]
MKRMMALMWTSLFVAALMAGCSGGNNGGRAQMSSPGPAEVKIIEPKDGATVPAGKPVTVKYQAHLSPRGNHLHFVVDGGKPDIVRELQGTHMIGPLSPGEHTLTVMEVTSSHTPTGHEASIKITAK